ncbi:serine dehydratase subunit alpha family protein [Salidesulfovibrio onnuriiensis]|uniref:L-cysteine desulfidase family protein n=1 Tax=Salidesulfovibrio onnuriiensis TaxID=2583823 RepID=UPI0011C7B69A|nr:L-serine ammonia-lyase, iron-sulfur-dependent, subunit alpha [Salidesulfovibrio onnuriiensis]
MYKAEWNDFIALLNREVVPALGCTEPITVALAAARAAEALGRTPETLDVKVSGNLLKNGMGVGVPGTGMTGLDIAAAVGALGGKADLSLEVLRDLTQEQVAAAKDMLSEKRVQVGLAETEELLYAEVTALAGADSARCVIAREHTAVVRVERNGMETFSAPLPGESGEEEAWPLSMEKIHDFAVNAPYEKLSFILEAARLNEAIAAEGMSHDWGLRVGKSMDEDIQQGLRADDIASFAIRMAAAASDARMDGIMLPVMSNSGSGNQGITATIPVVAFARRLKADDESLVRALIMSHLTAIHLKHHLGRLSALCGAILAATGSSCGMVMLMGGGFKEICFAIRNMVGNIAGMICDGAKNSCALKVASAVEAAVHAAFLAKRGTAVSGREGIVSDDIEACVRNLGRLGACGMVQTDQVILDIMVHKQ